MSFQKTISNDIRKFLQDNYFFFLIYIFILLITFYYSPGKTIESTVEGLSDDEWTFFLQAKLAQSSGYFSLLFSEEKYILNSIFINLSWFLSSLFNISDLLIYSILKSIIHMLSVCLFGRIFYPYFNKNIIRFSALMYLFDPYFLNLKLHIMRDDLISAFSFIFIYTFLFVIKKREIKSLIYLIFFYFCLLFLRPLQAVALIIFTPISFIFLKDLNLGKVRFISSNVFNSKYLAYIYSSIVFFSLVILSNFGYTFRVGLELLRNSNLLYVLYAFKDLFFAPSPFSIWQIITGTGVDISFEPYLNPYWSLIRFILLTFSIIFYLLIVLFKPYVIKALLNPPLILTILIIILYGIFTKALYTLGPRQGYFCYLLILPFVVQPFYLIFKFNEKKI